MTTSTKKPGKFPITKPALRRAGQSTEQTIENLIMDKGMPYGIAGLIYIFLALYEWIAWLINKPPHPVIMTVIVIPFVAFCFWRMFKIRAIVMEYRKGLAGEVDVAQFLDDHVRVMGYRVFHDVLERDANGATFNIDHVLIGPGGVFALETKTRTKPSSGEASVFVDGDMITVHDGLPDDEPIRQVRGSANRIRTILRSRTHRDDIDVRPVLLFPGWYIVGRGNDGVWVLEPKALPAWLGYEKPRLSEDEIARLAACLGDHVRKDEKLLG